MAGAPTLYHPDVAGFVSPVLEPTRSVCIDANTTWEVPKRLQFIKMVGSGAYGCVASFKDTKNNIHVAVKKIGDAFKDLVDAKRILREIKILRHLKHENIISILDMFPPNSHDFEDIYLVSELMETDLHRVIYSKQELTDDHYQYFVYQMLRGLVYLHSANVLHRDLKPSNILVNLNCDLKICDFGLARGLGMPFAPDPAPVMNSYRWPMDSSGRKGDWAAGTSDVMARERISRVKETPAASTCLRRGSEIDDTSTELTDYVVTRWYRSPEIILHPQHYEKPVDIWSVGCIFAELLGRKALFAGRDHLDQLGRIVKVLGTPSADDLDWLPKQGPNKGARKYLDSLSPSKGQVFGELYPKANSVGLDLLGKMLRFNPQDRITVEEALEHEYFEGLHMPEDEPRCYNPLDWSFDNFKPTKRILQNRVYEEMACYHPGILQRDMPMLLSKGLRLDAASIFSQHMQIQRARKEMRVQLQTTKTESSSNSSLESANSEAQGSRHHHDAPQAHHDDACN